MELYAASVRVHARVRSTCEIMTLHPPLTAATLSCGAAEHGVEMLQEGSLGNRSAHGQCNAARVNGRVLVTKSVGGSTAVCNTLYCTATVQLYRNTLTSHTVIYISMITSSFE